MVFRANLLFVLVALWGCQHHETLSDPKEGSGRIGSAAIPSNPVEAIRDALEGIRKDLVELKPAFPQLAGIERAVVEERPDRPGWYVLSYSQGFVRHDRAAFTIEKDGCQVFVEAHFPASEDESHARPIVGRAFPTKSGQFVVVWTLVGAETTVGGESFTRRAGEVIQSREDSLAKELRLLE